MPEPVVATAPPPFAISSENVVGSAVVTCAGELDLDVAAQARDVVTALLEARPQTLVLDLSGLTFLDSTGIRLLVDVHRLAVDADVRLTIVPAPEPVHHVVRLCGLDAVLPFSASTTAAA